MAIVPVVVVAIWAMLPAYLPNNVAVIAGGGRPIDGGRHWRGRRVLGDGKTWRGTIAGTAAGVAVAFLLNLLRPELTPVVGFGLPAFTPAAAVTLAAGAMFGDIGASFLKRRTGRKRGAAFPVVDQLDFVVGALGLTAVATPRWFASVFPLEVLVVVVVLTPVLHVGTNAVGYLLGLKAEPW